MDNRQTVRTLRIIQHNVRNWKTERINLSNIYREIDPDIILINSHGETENNNIKLFNYYVNQRNKSGEKNDGVAIAVKRNLKFKLIDDFQDEFLAIKINTTQGDVIIATTYLPPRRPYLPIEDLLKLANNSHPMYILGDFNARHRIFDNTNNNVVGNALNQLINLGKINHLGPNFPTWRNHNTQSTPDKIFTNNKAFFNYHIIQAVTICQLY